MKLIRVIVWSRTVGRVQTVPALFIENRKIYKTYMHFGQISDNGKLGVVGTPSDLGLILEHITNLNEVRISQ